MALAAYQNGQLTEAQQHLLAAERIFPDSAFEIPDFVVPGIDLGMAQIRLGKPESGLRLLRQVLPRVAAEDPDIPIIYHHMSVAQLRLGDWEGALESAIESARGFELRTVSSLQAGSQAAAEYFSLSSRPSYFLAAAAAFNLGRVEEAFTLVGNHRMSVLRALIRRRELAASNGDDNLWVRRRRVLSQISKVNIAIQRGDSQHADVLLARLEELLNERRLVEAALSRAADDLFVSEDLSLDQVRALLPEDTALIEYAALGTLVAFVIQRDEVDLVPLYDAREAEADVQDLRWTEGVVDYKRSAATLYARLFKPLKERWGPGIRRLLIIPDGALHLLPFETLIDLDDRFLLEDYTVSYLGTARELERKPQTAGGRELYAVGGAQYSKIYPTLPSEFGTGRDVSRGYCAGVNASWEDLDETLEEVGKVAELWEATVRTGPEATEANFKREASAHRFVLLSTHGYFADCASPAGTVRYFDERPMAFDPLVHSGVVFSGANQGGDGQEDGYLTALEILGMDFSATELVVLSACSTGEGLVYGPEGVLGLRRSFLAAGAESLLVSLWKVPDAPTRDLIVEFFRGIREGKSKPQSLREATLMLIRRGDRAPYYWAAFILVGGH